MPTSISLPLALRKKESNENDMWVDLHGPVLLEQDPKGWITRGTIIYSSGRLQPFHWRLPGYFRKEFQRGRFCTIEAALHWYWGFKEEYYVRKDVLLLTSSVNFRYIRAVHNSARLTG